MKETPQEYTQRMLGHTAGGQNPIKVQGTTAKKLEKLIKGVPAGKLKKRPAPDKWSVQEIVAHLADAEIAGSWRIRLILGAPGTPVQAFDQDAWVTAGHYNKRDSRQSIAQFRILREVNLALYKSLTPRTVETSWSACRARPGNRRAHSANVRRPRLESPKPDRANPRAEEKEIAIEVRTLSPRHRVTATSGSARRRHPHRFHNQC